MAITFKEYKENERVATAWHDYLVAIGKGVETTRVYLQVHDKSRQTLVWSGVVVTILIVFGVVFLQSPILQFLGFSLATPKNILPTIATVVLTDTPIPPTLTLVPPIAAAVVPTDTSTTAPANTSDSTDTPLSQTNTPVPIVITRESIAVEASISPTSPQMSPVSISMTSITTPTQEPSTPTSIINNLTWVNEYVRLSDDISLSWQICPGEPLNSCVTWNMNTDNQGNSVSAEILRCKQNGTWINENRVESIGLDVGKYARISGMTIRNSCPQIDPTTSTGLHLCGEGAFNGNLETKDPRFLRPEGYLSGWITSDPSTVILPNGMKKVFNTQYVLIVEDLPDVQLQGVQQSAGKANTWGCWYSADLSTFIREEAEQDFCKKKAGDNVAVLYQVNSSGFEELDTTTTVSCPYIR